MIRSSMDKGTKVEGQVMKILNEYGNICGAIYNLMRNEFNKSEMLEILTHCARAGIRSADKMSKIG